MKIVRGRKELALLRADFPGGLALAIGNFDGVHRGHQALVHSALALAAARGATAAVLTFDPHPAQLFAPALAPPLIVSLPRRLELLATAGAQLTIVEPFDAAFAAITAADFVIQVLGRDLDAREVVVGYDFSFGRDRTGDTRLLTELGASAGLGVTIVPRVSVGGLTCSSTKVREFVLEGRVDGAALLLGRPFEVTGVVVHGAGRGGTIGVPTANVQPDGELLPRIGIYAGRATVLPGGAAAGAQRPCAISVGTNPQFNSGGPVSVEAHLLDWDGDLYGQTLRVEFLHRLRGEQRFASVDALLAQINADILQTSKGRELSMFETETMAELYVKQGLVKKALAIYQNLVVLADDEITQARRRQRVSELEQQLASASTAGKSPTTMATPPGESAPAFTAPPPATLTAAEPKPLPLPGVRAEWDRRHTTISWRLPADTVAPALDLLLLMRTPAGIITERRTLPLATAEGRTALPVPDLYAVRVAAGRLEGQRFVPIVRVAIDP